MAEPQRIAIVRDERGQWFVRQVAYNHQDDTKGEMIYHCTKHLGGPYPSLEEVPQVKELMTTANGTAAVACWEKIKSQLEDRSVLHLGSVDGDTLGELEVEQIDTIKAALSSGKQPT